MSNSHFLEASLDISKWQKDLIWQRLRQAVNKTDWRDHAMVAIVNAFYNPLHNAIQFPAAILQPPFFHKHLPWYLNYGAIGTILGHEYTHAIDDEGCQFDSEGRLDNWWNEQSKSAFDHHAQAIIEQYGAFVDTKQTQLKLNGINTQGENIADNGGLKLAYRAYKNQVHFFEPGLPGLQQYSPDQLFLINMAMIHCTKARTEWLRDRILTNVHSPAEFRVNGIVMNFPHFKDLFHCADNDKMNPEKKCHVW